MAVIRDVELDTTSDNIIFIGTIGSLCLIFAVLGIKLRWFKHRMTFNDLPTATIPSAAQSDGMEPKIIRATFKPSSEFDNYVDVTPPKVLPPVRIHKSARNDISLPPRKRQAPEVPTVRISVANETNEPNEEIQPLQAADLSREPKVDNLIVDERRTSTPPPPLPISPPPTNDHNEERLLLALEADYPYTESETIKIKDNHNETTLPSPPPYQENDPLAHIHFKKNTKKKHSPTPMPTIENAVAVGRTETIGNESPKLRKNSFDSSQSPRDDRLGKRHSFLNQVPTPTQLPKLAFDFPTMATPNLNGQSGKHVSLLPSIQSEQSSLVVNDQSKATEKKSLLEYFGLKLGSKVENDANKTKNEKKVMASTSPKNEKKLVPVQPKEEKEIVPGAAIKKEKKTVPPVAPIERQKVKKIRVLKSDRKENVRKTDAMKNERLAFVDVPANVDNIRQPEKGVTVAQQNNFGLPNEKVMEYRMEIDYFHKVKKSKPNRVPIIVKSPKAEPKYEEKPPKNEVFRHEETFSAANGPLKVKKKKLKSLPQDVDAMKSIEIANTDVNQNISASSKWNEAENVPIPQPRAILKLDGFDDENRTMESNGQKWQKKVQLPALSSPSSPSDTEDAWNLVAKHRLNTRAITATAISVRKKSESDETTGSTPLQTKQLEMLTKPKTLREMKREQEERQEKMFSFGGKEDKDSDTEA